MAANKNSRRGSSSSTQPAGKAGVSKIFIPTAGGKRAYVVNPTNGSNPNLAVDSAEFDAAIALLVELGHSEKVTGELSELHEAQPTHGWDAVLSRVTASLA